MYLQIEIERIIFRSCFHENQFSIFSGFLRNTCTDLNNLFLVEGIEEYLLPKMVQLNYLMPYYLQLPEIKVVK